MRHCYSKEGVGCIDSLVLFRLLFVVSASLFSTMPPIQSRLRAKHSTSRSWEKHVYIPLATFGAFVGLAFLLAICNFIYRLVFQRKRSRANLRRQQYLPLGMRDTDAAMVDDDAEPLWEPGHARLVKQQQAVSKKEALLKKKVDKVRSELERYETQLNTARSQSAQLTSRLDTATKLTARETELLTEADRRGRELYGKEAWETGVDGNPPLRVLLSLEKGEIEQIREGVLTARKEQRTARRTARAKESARASSARASSGTSMNDVMIGDNYESHHDTIKRASNLTDRLRMLQQTKGKRGTGPTTSRKGRRRKKSSRQQHV